MIGGENMSEIKISYDEFDKAISKIKKLKNQCSSINCNIEVLSTGSCADMLKNQAGDGGRLSQIKQSMSELLSKTEQLLLNSKKEFKNRDETVGKKILAGDK